MRDIRYRARDISDGISDAAATCILGLAALLGTTLFWSTPPGYGERGFHYLTGDIAMASSLVLVAVSALRVRRCIGPLTFAAVATTAAGASTAACVWFFQTKVGEVLCPACFNPAGRLGAAIGWYLTVSASIAAFAVGLRALFDARSHHQGPPHALHWPVRSAHADTQES